MYKKALYVKKDGSEAILLWVGKFEKFRISRVSVENNKELDACEWEYIPTLDHILANIGSLDDGTQDYTYFG